MAILRPGAIVPPAGTRPMVGPPTVPTPRIPNIPATIPTRTGQRFLRGGMRGGRGNMNRY